jgi:predicted metal-dependent HD superfamily phosphohydrolase
MTRLDVSWLRAWNHLGREAPEGLKQQLLAAYAEPQRHYHTLQHLSECIALLDGAIEQAKAPGEVEVALWFHDAIYRPQAKDNEGQSAHWASRSLAACGVEDAVVDRVRALVMATCHEAAPVDPDQQLLVDIDLSILGAPEDRFAEYDRQIRAEYRWVPGVIYRFKRQQVLKSFLDRRSIYLTPDFQSKFETRARANLRTALG